MRRNILNYRRFVLIAAFQLLFPGSVTQSIASSRLAPIYDVYRYLYVSSLSREGPEEGVGKEVEVSVGHFRTLSFDREAEALISALGLWTWGQIKATHQRNRNESPATYATQLIIEKLINLCVISSN